MSGGEAASLSAVVVNYDGGDRAVACVRALMQHGDGIEEIILVDNSSSDRSRERILEVCPKARLILLAGNPGPRSRATAASRRRGATSRCCSMPTRC
jgi:glycosyltransferase involved in cell wall biosynthesis